MHRHPEDTEDNLRLIGIKRKELNAIEALMFTGTVDNEFDPSEDNVPEGRSS